MVLDAAEKELKAPGTSFTKSISPSMRPVLSTAAE
jgi:hypothetical protein